MRPNFFKTFIICFLGGLLGTILMIPFFALIVKNDRQTINTPARENFNLISLTNFSETSVAVSQKVLPSVVGIEVEFSGTNSEKGSGSGVIISNDGYILTNSHVITSSTTSVFRGYTLKEAYKIKVYLYQDETPYTANIVGNDPQTDLSVLKIDKTDLTPAELGDSSTIQIGEFCMAVGNPLGIGTSVSAGIISGLDRKIIGDNGVLYTLIQTDTAINAGNSGGALVNSSGQVIGINTIKASGSNVEGVGFTIPINQTKTVFADLIKYNKVIRPYIGLSGISITDEIIKQYPQYNLKQGIYIRSIGVLSPAEQAGLKVGDIIFKINDKNVKTMFELDEIKNSHSIGDVLTLKIYRNGYEKEIKVKLSEN